MNTNTAAKNMTSSKVYTIKLFAAVIVVSQSVCPCQSVPPQYDICGQGSEPTSVVRVKLFLLEMTLRTTKLECFTNESFMAECHVSRLNVLVEHLNLKVGSLLYHQVLDQPLTLASEKRSSLSMIIERFITLSYCYFPSQHLTTL